MKKKTNKIKSIIFDLDTSITYHLSTFNISDSNMDNKLPKLYST